MFAVPEGSRALFSSIVFSRVSKSFDAGLAPRARRQISHIVLGIIGRQSLIELTSCNVHTWESILLQKSFAFADSGFGGTNARFQNGASFRNREHNVKRATAAARR